MTLTHKILWIAAGTLTLVALGRWSTEWGGADDADVEVATSDENVEDEPAEPEIWSCPMHAQIRLPDPGGCPICGMDLVLLNSGGDDDPRRLAMSPAAKELARIITQPVQRKNLTRPVRMTGKVDYDESTVRTISAWVPGRLDRLFVDYTGVRAEKGDHLVQLYSPDLLTAQEELLSTRDRIKATEGEASRFLPDSNVRAYAAAREKLLLWGLTEEQVAAIEERGTTEDYVMLTSPTSGIVIEKMLDEGAYVKTGTPIYSIADLDHLWVRLDAYEQDLPWLRHGQQVVLEVEALPGESFEGSVSYIDPFLHEHSRTAKVRVNLDNTDGRLKPGMFVSAVAMARIGAGGAVIDRHLAGKWVGPMHPEIVKDGPGACDVCGMDLVPAEDLGMVSGAPPDGERPVVVPSSAVLVTGKRAVVYVEVPDAERPTYEGREVRLGPRAGDEYIVLAGLEDGERVVVNGAFRIDSSMQIRAKASMMDQPGDSGDLGGPEGQLFRAALDPLYSAYLAVQDSLAADDEAAARVALAAVAAAIESLPAAGLPSAQRTVWSEERAALQAALDRADKGEGIEHVRSLFKDLSTATLVIAREFGHDRPESMNEAFCPMAFDDKGAVWIQSGDAIRNPYFGSSMLGCGELRQTFGAAGEVVDEHAGHRQTAPAEEEEDEVDPHAGHGDMDQASAPEAAESAPAGPLAAVMDAYIALQTKLAADAPAGAAAAELMQAVVGATQSDEIAAESKSLLHEMHSALHGIGAETSVTDVRSAFRDVSTRLIGLVGPDGNPLGTELQVVHCPMAFGDTGADWIQAPGDVANPYFGAEMLRCGKVTRTLSASEE